jgi:hypothetical protein
MADVDGKVSRGIRNNNPGNIRRSSTHWQGMSSTQSDTSFITFDTPEHGIRAMTRIILNYQQNHQLNTVDGIVNRWAPPTENNTVAYVNAVARNVGVTPSTPIDLQANPQILSRLVNAIILHENGSNPYDPEVVSRGVQLRRVHPVGRTADSYMNDHMHTYIVPSMQSLAPLTINKDGFTFAGAGFSDNGDASM